MGENLTLSRRHVLALFSHVLTPQISVRVASHKPPLPGFVRHKFGMQREKLGNGFGWTFALVRGPAGKDRVAVYFSVLDNEVTARGHERVVKRKLSRDMCLRVQRVESNHDGTLRLFCYAC